MAELTQDELKRQLKEQELKREELEDQEIQLIESLKRLKEKEYVLKLEEDERRQHHGTLKQVYENAIGDSKGGKSDNAQEQAMKEEEEKQAQKQVENKVNEKLNFHMDKYLTFIEQNIKHSVKPLELDLDQYTYTPTPVTAVIVRCLKTNITALDPNTPILGTEDDEAFRTTFKVTKRHSIEDLKKVLLSLNIKTAVKYWNLLTTDEKIALKEEEEENSKHQQQDEKKDQGDQKPQKDSKEEEKSASRIGHSSGAQAFQRFEMLDETGEVIGPADTIDKFIQMKQASPTSDNQYLTLTLQRKRRKAIKNKRKGELGETTTGKGETTTKIQGTIDGTSKPSDNKEESKVEGLQQDDIDEEEEEEEDQDDKFKKYMQDPLYQAYKKLFQRLPLIEKYFVIDDEEVIQKSKFLQGQELRKKGFKLDDNHCCVVFCLLIMLLLNSIFFMMIANQPIFISHNSQLNQLLKITNAATIPGTQPLTWLTISTITDLTSYLSDLQGMPYSLFQEDSLLRQTYEIIGAIRIRQIRTKQIECPFPRRTDRISQVVCIYEYQNSATEFTGLIGQGNKQWQVYTPIAQVGISRISTGLFGTYDASGYILDITKKNCTISYYQNTVINDALKSGQYFDIETLVQVMTFTLRSTNDGTFIFIEFLLEYTSTGIFPAQPTIIPFSPNIYGTQSSTPFSVYGATTAQPPQAPSDFNVGVILYVVDIFRTMTGIVFILLVLVSFKNNDQGQGFNFRYFISLTFVLNVAVIVTTFMSIASNMAHGNYGLQTTVLQELNEFQDLGDVALLYNKCLVNISLATCVIMIRLTMLLSFFKSKFILYPTGFDSMIYTIEHSYLQLLASFVVLILVVFGFTFVSISIWGYYLSSFSSFGSAMLSLLLLSMGQLDLSSTLSRGLSLAIPFLGGYYLFIYQYMFGIIVVIYIDSYRMTIIDKGTEVNPKDLWTWRDFMHWLFNWAPASIYNRFVPKQTS